MPDVRERLDRIDFLIDPATPGEYDEIARGRSEGFPRWCAGLKPK